MSLTRAARRAFSSMDTVDTVDTVDTEDGPAWQAWPDGSRHFDTDACSLKCYLWDDPAGQAKLENIATESCNQTSFRVDEPAGQTDSIAEPPAPKHIGPEVCNQIYFDIEDRALPEFPLHGATRNIALRVFDDVSKESENIESEIARLPAPEREEARETWKNCLLRKFYRCAQILPAQTCLHVGIVLNAWACSGWLGWGAAGMGTAMHNPIIMHMGAAYGLFMTPVAFPLHSVGTAFIARALPETPCAAKILQRRLPNAWNKIQDMKANLE